MASNAEVRQVALTETSRSMSSRRTSETTINLE